MVRGNIRNVEMTRECISFTFDAGDMLLSIIKP